MSSVINLQAYGAPTFYILAYHLLVLIKVFFCKKYQICIHLLMLLIPKLI